MHRTLRWSQAAQEATRENPESLLHAARQILRPALLAGLILLALFLSSCSDHTVYEPLGSKDLYGRRVLFLNTLPQQGISKDLHAQILGQVESGLAQSSNFKGVLQREDFDSATAKDATLRHEYELFSETLGSVGVSERTISRHLAKATQTDFLIAVQPFFIPCEYCEKKNQFVLSAHVIDAQSGAHAWRASLRQKVSDPSPEAVAEVGAELGEVLLGLINNSFQPKWHLVRFQTLAARN